ncbi:MAG: NAD(P)/FAD-dependent oxidoreductase [Ardenticatenaceae bacterium]|nr:NAD(P)/FAD-dependent oxidoreductase [Ardenticatenaceae bacterium]
MNRYDIIIIGGGPAGTTAALRARELGATVAVVEGGRMGGTCTNDGCAPTRVLAKAARLMRDAEQLEAYGLTPHAPQVNLEKLMERVQQTIDQLHEKKQIIKNLQEAGAEVFANVGPARFVDPHTVELGDGRRLVGKRFIICVGGHPRPLNFPGSEHALNHHDIWRMRELPSSIVIVGGAATGCQLATIFDTFGAKVTLLEIAPDILGAEDEAISKAIANGFEARGIEVVTGISGLEQIEKTAGGVRVHYGHNQQSHLVEAAAVILAVGWVGNIDALNLEAAGVEHDGRYIRTDPTMQSSVPHIFAAGDINGRAMLVQSAAHEARTAAENAILRQQRPFGHQILPHGGFTDPEYGSVGLTEAQARAQEPDCVVAVANFADLDRAVIDGRTEGMCKLIVSRRSERLLGAHVVGEQALEIVEIAAACIAGSISITEIARLEIAYPTFTMIVGLTARRIVREMGLTQLAPEWRALRQSIEATAEWEKPRYKPLNSK